MQVSMSRAALFGSVTCLLLASCVEIEWDVEQRSGAVIGGSPAAAGEFEATGALLTGGGVLCTGTLVAPDAVLTAAHCLSPLLTGGIPPSFTLALDASAASDGQIYTGASAYPHPDYNMLAMSQGLGQNYDVGVLLLDEPVVGVAPAILPTPAEANSALAPGMSLEIVGYGVTEPSALLTPGVKQKAETTLIEVGLHEILLSNPGQPQNCRGDSGGPAFADLGGGLRLLGLVSRGEGGLLDACDSGHGIDTRADAYLDYIHSLADLPCGSGLNPPCGSPDAGPIDDPVEADAGPEQPESRESFTPKGCSAARANTSPAGLSILLALLLFLLRGARRRHTP